MAGGTATYFKRFRMEVTLSAARPRPALPAGYRMVPWNEAVLDAHARTKYASFRDEIDAVVFPCLGDLEGCRRLMREIRNKPGFLPAATWLVVRGESPDDLRWCGTIQGIAERGGTGMIQNIGVVPGHRGLGLGRCLIEETLAAFRRHGLWSGALEVTADNSRAVRLYKDLGFRKVQTVYKVVEQPAADTADAGAEWAEAALF